MERRALEKRFHHSCFYLSTPPSRCRGRCRDSAIALFAKQSPFSCSFLSLDEDFSQLERNREQRAEQRALYSTQGRRRDFTKLTPLLDASPPPKKKNYTKQMPRSLSSKRILLSAAFAAFIFVSMLSASSASRPLVDAEVSNYFF